jgi:subtilisin family serine protease
MAVPSTASSIEEVSESMLSRLVRELAKDSRFIAVTPNTIISPFGIKSAIDPIPLLPSPEAKAEEVDWGILDGKFEKFWASTTKPFVIGVIDVGFAEHEDLITRNGLKVKIPLANHGNHVAGIMCAKHNGIGTKGALKNCTTVISAGQFLLTGENEPQGSGVSSFKTSFSEYLATVLEFMEANKDVKIINLSLGYNWMPNFGIDPRVPSANEIRNEVMGQGRFFAAVLAYAKAHDVALVSAAGNDSSTLKEPLEAKWASPFNFGALLVEEKDGWTNGLIVEAHNSSHERADFSNDGGHISCPGVDVLSLLATSKKAYGRMSGTSMASPYCAAGLAALRVLRPDLDLRQAIHCLRSSPDKIGNVPRMNLEYSISKCKPANSSTASAD